MENSKSFLDSLFGYGRKREQLEGTRSDVRGVLLKDDDDPKGLMCRAVDALITASGTKPLVASFEVTSMWPKEPIMKEHIFRQLILEKGKKLPDNSLRIIWDEFLELSSRERGIAWDEVKVVAERLAEVGIRVREITIKCADGFSDRTWDYPATIHLEQV